MRRAGSKHRPIQSQNVSLCFACDSHQPTHCECCSVAHYLHLELPIVMNYAVLHIIWYIIVVSVGSAIVIVIMVFKGQKKRRSSSWKVSVVIVKAQKETDAQHFMFVCWLWFFKQQSLSWERCCRKELGLFCPSPVKLFNRILCTVAPLLVMEQ